MAAAPEPGRSVLRRLAVLLLDAGVALVALALLLALVVSLRPEFALRAAALAAEQGGVLLDADSVEGDPARGFTVRGLRAASPRFSASAAEVRVRPDLGALLRARLGLASLRVDAPRLVVFERRRGPPGAGPESGAPERRGSPRLPVEIASLRVTDGDVRWPAPEGLPRRAEQATLALEAVSGGWIVKEANALVAGSTVAASGSLRLEPPALDLHLTVSGAASKPVQARVTLDETGAWTVEAEVRGLDPKAVYRKAPEGAGPLDASLRAAGQSRDPLSDGAWARLSASEAGGPAVTARLKAGGGSVEWDAQVSSGGLSGASEGRWRREGSVEARLRLRAGPAFLRRLPRAPEGTLRLEAQARGPARRPAWRAEASVSGLRLGALAVAEAAVRADSPGGPAVRAVLTSSGVAQGRLRLNAVEASVEGSSASHRLSVSARAGGTRLDAAATAALERGTWTAVWDAFSLGPPGPLRSTAPFVLSAAPRRLSLEGFAVTDGTVSVSASGLRLGDAWEPLRVRVRRFEPSAWAPTEALPLRGVFDADLDLRGPAAAPRGSFRVEAGGVGWKEFDVGRVSAHGDLSDRRLRLDRLSIGPKDAALTASGSAPLPPWEGPFPDFDLAVQAESFDLLPAARLAKEASVERPVLDGRLSVSARSGRLSFAGRLEARAERAAAPRAGLALDAPKVVLRGEAGDLVVEGSAASGRRGKVEFGGEADTEGFGLGLQAGRLPFESPLGVEGLLDAELRLLGTWSRPAVEGTVNVLRADYTPPKKPKGASGGGAEAEEGPPRGQGPLAMDVRLTFERDVWFKDDETAVEVKGDLRVRKEPFGPARLLGTAEAVRGSYSYFGRTFEIESGRALFTEGAQRDPLLEGRALYVDPASRTRIFLELAGTLRQPRLSLRSEPAMEQRDIISVLLLGRPVEAAGGQEVDMRQAAEEYISNYLTRGIRRGALRRLDLDVLRIRRQGPSSTDITVGRYLTRDLFVSFGQTLGQEAQRRLEAVYTLTPKWSLEGRNSSDGRYIVDLLFRVGWR